VTTSQDAPFLPQLSRTIMTSRLGSIKEERLTAAAKRTSPG
jgi:hypothetical protein